MTELQTILDALHTRIDSLEQIAFGTAERATELEKVLYEDIITPAKAAYDEQVRVDNINSFRERNPGLQDFDAELRAIEGDDFDVYAHAFDEYSAVSEDMEEAAFVASLAESIANQLVALKERLGIAGEVTATLDENGNVEIENEGQPVDETEEPINEGKEVSEDASVAEPTVTEEEEIRAFEEELLKSLDKL